MAYNNNVDLAFVQGTGKDGRITKEDVLNYINNKDKPPAPKVAKKSVDSIKDSHILQ